MKQLDSMVYADGKINIWDGAIRAGKTVGSLLRWLKHIDQAPDGELVMVGKTVQSVYRNLFIPLMEMDPTGISYTPGAPMGKIWGRGVHVIGAADAKAETKIRGFTSAGAYVDEGTLVPEDFFKTLLGRLSVLGSKMFLTTNPDNPAHWMRRDYLLKQSGDVRHFHFKITDNPFLDPAYLRWIMESYTGLYYRRFIGGEWVSAAGAIYDMWDDATMITDESPPIERWLALAVDYGTRNPFHALLMGLGVDKRLHIVSEYRYEAQTEFRQKTDSAYAGDIAKFLENPPGTKYKNVKPMWTIVDPSAASFRTELHSRKWNTYKANNSVEDGIRVVSTLLDKGALKINKRCTGLIKEIPGYAWDDKAALERGADEPIKVNDHGCDALRYAVYTTRGVWMPLLADEFAMCA